MTPDFPRVRVTIATELPWKEGEPDRVAEVSNKLLAAADGMMGAPRIYRTDAPELKLTTLVLEGTVDLLGEDTPA